MRQALLITTLLVSTFAYGAGFDCTKASTKVERLICSDGELSDLDKTLSEVFSLELDREKDAPGLRASQKKWLAARNSCGNALCIKQQYERRISELSCDPQSRMAGSAIGSNQCSHFSLGVLEQELSVLEARYSKKVLAESNNPEYTERTLLAEQKAWRDYRGAQCALYGATEGGSDGWKNAFAGMCEVNETQGRITRLKQEVETK